MTVLKNKSFHFTLTYEKPNRRIGNFYLLTARSHINKKPWEYGLKISRAVVEQKEFKVEDYLRMFLDKYIEAKEKAGE
jgi:hypothetical protein